MKINWLSFKSVSNFRQNTMSFQFPMTLLRRMLFRQNLSGNISLSPICKNFKSYSGEKIFQANLNSLILESFIPSYVRCSFGMQWCSETNCRHPRLFCKNKKRLKKQACTKKLRNTL